MAMPHAPSASRDLTSSDRCLVSLPKADLHLHLEGAMRPGTLAELASTYDEPMPQVNSYRSFDEFQHCYRAVVKLIRTRGDIRRLVREVVEDAAASGAVWIEPHFNPTTYAPALGSAQDVLDLVLDTGTASGRTLGVGFGLILSASRNRDPRDATVLARLAADYAGRGVVAFGLTGDEAATPPEAFSEAFAIARDVGLIVAPHTGELVGGPSIRGTLDVLSPDRIAHGVRAVEHPALVEHLANERITLDVCLTSNRVLGVVKHIEEHPLLHLLESGVPCSLGSDDPLLLKTSMLTEYQIARTELSMTDWQLAAIASTSIQSSGAPTEFIAHALTGIEDWMKRDIPDPAEGHPHRAREDCDSR
ncbi:adenosine deaminase [Streptomyces sp. G7(2002)]|uniref:adenosine deaminase n=1 Tax=Streptomyces sp. G7(2002) TaxID=2971798 RepID=UPI00237EABC2|nr:adenosine deaminase [Streptomyces sp. G7(2002)]WDT54187.1 adenosine deaminase [Streptomyces sp. G7(2002)]